MKCLFMPEHHFTLLRFSRQVEPLFMHLRSQIEPIGQVGLAAYIMWSHRSHMHLKCLFMPEHHFTLLRFSRPVELPLHASSQSNRAYRAGRLGHMLSHCSHMHLKWPEHHFRFSHPVEPLFMHLHSQNRAYRAGRLGCIHHVVTLRSHALEMSLHI